MLLNKGVKSSDTFWQEYEEKTGEKILKRGLGKYISGWNEFDEKKWGGIWGLLITTSGGFRFHHFPQYSWIDSFTSFAQKVPLKEKTLFIPDECIVSTEYIKEKNILKKVFVHTPPRLIIRYFYPQSEDVSGREEKRLIFEAEYNPK